MNVDDQLEEVAWTKNGYKVQETNMSYSRRKDSRTDEDFANSMAETYVNEKYASEKLLKKLELYSPYDVIEYEILVTSEVYKDSNYRDEGDLLVKFSIDEEIKTIIFDLKAVPPKNRQGKSLRNHKRIRINMDSHEGMIKKGHVAIPMIGTAHDTERINILITDDMKNIDSRLNWSSSPKMGYHHYEDKYFYDLDENDSVFDIPWFSMTDENPSDDSIENFRKMIRRAVI